MSRPRQATESWLYEGVYFIISVRIQRQATWLDTNRMGRRKRTESQEVLCKRECPLRRALVVGQEGEDTG